MKRLAALHHRSDFGWESEATLFMCPIGAGVFIRLESFQPSDSSQQGDLVEMRDRGMRASRVGE
jgi:hypothetical protein